MNRMAQIIYENKDGTIMQMGKETLPFDKEANHLNILDEDYGVWYMDALEHPYDYEGKTITYVAKVYPMLSPMENRYVLGREAMVCCSDDTSLIGLWVIGKEERPVTGSWVKITGKVTIEYDLSLIHI